MDPSGPLTSVIAGQLTGTVTTTVYRDGNGFLLFDYVIARDTGGSGFVVAAAADGPGWDFVNIPDAGADPTGAFSGTGDSHAEWSDGKPYFISRDPDLGTPSWVFRAPGTTGTLIGTVIGKGNTSAHVWFQTDATSVGSSYMALSDSGSTGRALILVPLPEPASLVLLGLGGLLFVRRRSSRA